MSEPNVDVKIKFGCQNQICRSRTFGCQKQIWTSEPNLDVKTKFIGQEQVWTLKPNLDVDIGGII